MYTHQKPGVGQNIGKHLMHFLSIEFQYKTNI